jgi:hypothetical protein
MKRGRKTRYSATQDRDMFGRHKALIFGSRALTKQFFLTQTLMVDFSSRLHTSLHLDSL